MSTVRLNYVPFPKQCAVHASKARFRVVAAGVRGGKTKLGAGEILRDAIRHGKEGCHWWCTEPWTEQLFYPREAIDELLGNNFDRVVKQWKEKQRVYVLRNGGMIWLKGCDNENSLRGAGVKGIWADEVAFVKASALKILRTRVSDTAGWMLLTSTPKGKNAFYEWCAKGIERKKGYEFFHWESRDNPHFPAAEWEAVKADLPSEFFAQEYEAKFLDSAAGVFRMVDEAFAAGAQLAERGEKVEGPYVVGVDVAKSVDWTVMTVMNSSGRQVDFDRFHKLPWPEARARILDMIARWGALVVIDSTGVGDPVRDDLVSVLGDERVVGIKFTPDLRSNMVRAVQSSMEQRALALLPSPGGVMEDELRWFEFAPSASGSGGRYQAARGFHDDCVWSLALANWGRIHYLGERAGEPVVIEVARPMESGGQFAGADVSGSRVDWGRSRLSKLFRR